MAKNIRKIASDLGAEIIGQVPETGGGAIGAAQLARFIEIMQRRCSTESKDSTAYLRLFQRMIDTGLITQLPDLDADYDDPEDQPITIEGEPLSETIIRERR